MPATHHVSVGAFEGPFDLLLHLIARRKLDIYEVSLAQITDDYLAVLRDMEAVDLERTTEFLVVAATLVELKAARLLPDEDDPDVDEVALEARDLLYARLLDYRVFKEAAGWLGERMESFAGFVPRRVSIEERFAGLRPDVTLPVTPLELAALAARVLAERPLPTVDVSHLQPVRLTVHEAAGMVVDELERAGGQASFRELTAGCRHRVEVIVYFLALLELFKLEVVDLAQAASFGQLDVTLNPDAPFAASSLAAMDPYEATDLEDGSARDAGGRQVPARD